MARETQNVSTDPVRHSGREKALLAGSGSSGAYFFLDLSLPRRGRVRVAFGGREHCDERYVVDRLTFPYVTLEYVTEGEGQIQYGAGEPQLLEPGTLFGHGPGVKVRMHTGPGRRMVKHFVCFAGQRARAAVARHAPVFGRVMTLGRHADIRDVFDLMLREGAAHTPYTREICGHLGALLLLKISQARRHRTGPQRDAARERFQRSKALIDENPARFATLGELAGALHAEASGLNRLFRRFQGISPYQYLLRARMNAAAQDLLHGGGLVKEVAARAGYADPYHFSRVFKSVHGVAPAHFVR